MFVNNKTDQKKKELKEKNINLGKRSFTRILSFEIRKINANKL